jgi:segregation and condensation protein A
MTETNQMTEMSEQLRISLPHYEGPLDLLLDLIRRQKLDIYDIPIAEVTSQYLAFLRLLEEMNVDMVADFLPMAAQLIYIKSRMLLPPDPNASSEEEEDPRAELVQRLLEYEKFRNAAEMLYQRELVEKAAWTRAGQMDLDPEELEPEITATLYDMLSVFNDVLGRFEERPSMNISREEFSVEQMARFVIQELEASAGGMSFTRLLEQFRTKGAIVAAFLALLELARLNTIRIGQKDAFGDIRLSLTPENERSAAFSVA